ncbi:carbohydrate ABC transporter permease [Rhodoferax aquaticus]|uniref:Sugar ABC transporter permease n=1 Tax=Rhodoferax aquaticus TaxID=2527691 RepID=A0A515EQ34_9BURK|nr:sugar ABC transporter permease [Rhodoferax aquaticus]QDL54783.1 sugar ABC transporter permease [Rhodoferax aquaticus]
MRKQKPGKRPNWGLHLALLPMAITAIVGYLATLLWSIFISFTSSKMFPNTNLVGFDQYHKLFASERWQLSLQNLALFAVVGISLCMVLGFLLAVFIDQKIRSESIFRSIFLYPYAMSFVVTGLVWQWMLNPEMGIQSAVRRLGFESFQLDWIVTQDKVMYCIILAAVWQASGLVMAILLAGLRGIDEEIWKAARLDGIPTWRVYLNIVLPMIQGAVATAFILQAIGAIKVYDAVNSMTRGGPGLASEVPAKFILDHLFQRGSIALASAASVVMLLTVVALLVPYYYINKHQAAQKNAKA